MAFDLAEEMIAHALERMSQHRERISYSVLDATDEAALLALGETQFDAAICLLRDPSLFQQPAHRSRGGDGGSSR
jgi:hypothetical protein